MGTIKRDNSDWGKMKVIVFVWKEHKGKILIGHTFGITNDRLDDWSKKKT
jgi:hypothetical protein